MLSRIHRFHGLGSLNFTYQNGQTVRSSLLSLKFVRNSRRQTYRVAVVVSRKVHKSAVLRNRIRRRIYAAVQVYEADLVTQPVDLVFTVFGELIAQMDAKQLDRLVADLLHKAGVIMRGKSSGHAIVKTERKGA